MTSVKFRIKAKQHRLPAADGQGQRLEDVRRRQARPSTSLPDGQQRRAGLRRPAATARSRSTIIIPGIAIPDASKILVKVYPGVISQVMEGMEGMLRMPNGCLEQTSSSAYPNVLVVDYMKKSKTGSPAVLMKAEQFLNVGYQRLLTFERPGGGFDWWGSGPPLVWLSAYGSARVQRHGQGLPGRPRRHRPHAGVADEAAGAGRHLVEHRRHARRDDRADGRSQAAADQLRRLVAAGQRPAHGPQLDKAIEYIRDHVEDAKDNAYILALAANALAA